jgi:hypothetical protein
MPPLSPTTLQPLSSPPITFLLSNSTNAPATAGSPRSTPTSTGPLTTDRLHSSGSNNSPTAGYLSAEFETASAPTTPTLAPTTPTLALVAWAETKSATTSCVVLHSSQIDDLSDNLVNTKTQRPLTTAIVQGLTGWFRNRNYQIPISRYNLIRPNIVLRKALTRQNAIGWGRMYFEQISQDFQTMHNIDRPRGSHDRPDNAACLSDWASELITLLYCSTKSKIKLRNEALHGRDDAEHSLFHRALLFAKATRLYAKAGTLLALNRLILSRPLTTILDLSTTAPEAYSAADDNHVQANTIDDYFPHHRDG